MFNYTEKAIYKTLYALQEEYNAHTNITRINSEQDFYNKHILDSLAIAELVQNARTLIDVGTGAGYPGIPLAIEKPHLHVTLNDSQQKKLRYLADVVKKLNLINVQILSGRAEDLGQNTAYREKFDAATARAVAELPTLLEYLAPLVAIGGHLYIFKAKNIQDELTSSSRAATLLGVQLKEAKSYSLSGIERVILCYQKIKPTPRGYPRKPGTPKKQPI